MSKPKTTEAFQALPTKHLGIGLRPGRDLIHNRLKGALYQNSTFHPTFDTTAYSVSKV
jgi:hypothetical protein